MRIRIKPSPERPWMWYAKRAGDVFHVVAELSEPMPQYKVRVGDGFGYVLGRDAEVVE